MSGTPDVAGFHKALLDDDPEALYDTAPCGYLSTAPDGTVVKVNRTFRVWTGHTSDDVVGRRRLSSLLTPGAQIYFETHVNPMLHALGEVKEIALDVVKADGDRMPVLVNAVLDRGPDGQPRAVRVAVFDATERRHYEQELLLAKSRAEQSEKRAVRLARTLQQTLIPPRTPTIPGLEVAAAYRPAGQGDEVGGDFYDVFQIGEGDWVAVLGDVCGKGVEAAVVTSLVRHTVRALAVSEPTLLDVLHQLNDILLAGESDRFCTVVLLRLRRARGAWEVTSIAGGHPLPLLLRPGMPTAKLGEPGMVVGAVEEAQFTEAEVLLGEGDSLFLYTDGVTEASRSGEFFGELALLDALAGPRTAPALVDEVLERVLAFQQNVARDDIALLAIRATG